MNVCLFRAMADNGDCRDFSTYSKACDWLDTLRVNGRGFVCNDGGSQKVGECVYKIIEVRAAE